MQSKEEMRSSRLRVLRSRLDLVPQVFEETSTAIIRNALGIDDTGSRVLYIIVFRKLYLITTLSGDEFLPAWWEVARSSRPLEKGHASPLRQPQQSHGIPLTWLTQERPERLRLVVDQRRYQRLRAHRNGALHVVAPSHTESHCWSSRALVSS